MATVHINQFPTAPDLQLSDRIRVYNLSGDTYVPDTMEVSQLSNFIFSGDQMEEVKDKFNSLKKTYVQFRDWLSNNYFTLARANSEICTSAYFRQVYDSVYSVDRVKRELLDDYATPQDLENLRAAIYAYVEQIALSYSALRSSILTQMNYVNLMGGKK